MKRNRGFTLIELMVVVTIMAIVLAIAVPVYRDYQRIAIRKAAGVVLLEVVSKQEQYAISNRAYATGTDLSVLAITVPAEVSGAYDFNMTQSSWVSGTVTMTGFSATATPKAGSAMAGDITLGVNQFGLRTPVGQW